MHMFISDYTRVQRHHHPRLEPYITCLVQFQSVGKEVHWIMTGEEDDQ